jgi:lysophospholipase L1-like esterase
MDWYEEEVEQLIQQRDRLPYQPQTVFYGSSSIRMWDTLYEDFKAYLPVNLGFGGSTLEACVHFFDRIVAPVQSAQRVIVYAGDNDLGDGRSPEEVAGFFMQLRDLIKQHFPFVHFYYISIKPSISRWIIDDNIKNVNHFIANEIEAHSHTTTFINVYDAMIGEDGYPVKEYYDEDGLHLTQKGYEVWKQILLTQAFGKDNPIALKHKHP